MRYDLFISYIDEHGYYDTITANDITLEDFEIIYGNITGVVYNINLDKKD